MPKTPTIASVSARPAKVSDEHGAEPVALRRRPGHVLERPDVAHADQLLAIDAGDGGAHAPTSAPRRRPWRAGRPGRCRRSAAGRSADRPGRTPPVRPGGRAPGGRRRRSRTTVGSARGRDAGRSASRTPERRPAAQMPAHQGLVHEAHRRAVGRVAIAEAASGDDRQLDRLEVLGAHEVAVGGRPLALVHRRIADDLERQVRARRSAVSGSSLVQATRGDAGDGRGLAAHRVVELQQRLGRGVARSPAGRPASSGPRSRGSRGRTSRRRRACAAAARRRPAARRRSPPRPPTSSRAEPSAAAGDGAAVGRQHRRRVEARRLPRRRDAEQQPDDQRRRRRRRRPRADRRRRSPPAAAGPAGISDGAAAGDGGADAEPEQAAEDGQHEALGDQLADHPRRGPRRAPRGSPARACAPPRAPSAGWRRWRSR